VKNVILLIAMAASFMLFEVGIVYGDGCTLIKAAETNERCIHKISECRIVITVDFTPPVRTEVQDNKYTYDWLFTNGSDKIIFLNKSATSATIGVNGNAAAGNYFATVNYRGYLNGQLVCSCETNVNFTIYKVSSVSALVAGGKLAHAKFNESLGFTCIATSDPPGYSESFTYEWKFGDRATSNEQNPSHTYSTGGVYQAEVNVKCCNTPYTGVKDTCDIHVLSGIVINEPTLQFRPNVYKLSFNNSNHVKGKARPTTLPNCCHNLLDWDLDKVPTPDCNIRNNAEGNLIWTQNWPANNRAWGPGDALNATINKPRFGSDDLSTAGELQASIRIAKYFDGSDNATQHPGGISPNWYYYWSNTRATYGTHVYNPSITTDTIRYIGGAWVAQISIISNDQYTCPAGGDLGGITIDGIDNFAWGCRHEGRHVEDATLWFPNNYNHDIDLDGDWLPDQEEPRLGGTLIHPINGGPFYPGFPDSDNDGIRDEEDYAIATQQHWRVGSADNEDWSHPGHQWR
jgi:hypothetical protein